jgi:hypothetical protein
MGNDRVGRASRHFKRLITLYPDEYRERFGDEMTQVFRTTYRAKLASGESIMELWVQTYIDIGVNAMAQSLKTKSTSDDALGRTIIGLSKLTNWLVLFALWAVLAGTLDLMVVRPLYNLLPSWFIGGTEPLTFSSFGILINTIFGLCLVPLIMTTNYKLRGKLLHVLLGAFAFVIAPSVIRDLTYYSDGSALQVVGSFVVRDGAVITAILVAAKLFVLARRQQLKWARVRTLLQPYLIPGIIVAGLAVLERVTKYYSLATASKTDFLGITGHHEVQIILLLAVTIFVLTAFGAAKKLAAYFIFCTFIVLSGINLFSVQTSHNDYCQQLITSMYTMSNSKFSSSIDKGYEASIKTQLNDNCHMPYDITSQFVSTPDTSQ